jgi:ABC-2 type transport system permease protein
VRDMFLVMKREFRERVASKSFLIGTLVFPLLMIALFVLPRFVGGGGSEWRLALVNEAPGSVGSTFAAALGKGSESRDDNRYTLVPVEGTIADLREKLAGQVQQKEIDGYVVLPPDILGKGALQLRSRKAGSFAVVRDLRTAATRAVQGERLKASGIDPSAVAALVAPVTVNEARITVRGEEESGAFSTFLAAYVVAFLIYLMVTLYGVTVMRSVLEEKTNRIAEVLISTIRAWHLMAGKIIGVGSAAVTQVLIWIVVMTVVVTQSPRLGDRFALPPMVQQALTIEPLTGVLLFLFFLFGFFLYASIFAIVGAAVTSEQEAQSVQFMALIPLILPLMFLQPILNAPLGPTATTLGIIPFTAPIAMAMRMASAPIPPLEIAISLALLLVAIVAIAWIAGKVYRVGILSTGKRPTPRELIRWIRTA